MKKVILALAIILGVMMVSTSCKEKKDVETQVEEALEETGETLEEAAEKVEEAVEETGEELEKAAKDLEEKIDSVNNK